LPLRSWKQVASLASRHEQLERSCRLFFEPSKSAAARGSCRFFRFATGASRFPSTIKWREFTMRSLLKRRWVLGLVAVVLTAASYAQWSNPADDVPAYHPSAPLKVSALPPILTEKQFTKEHFPYPWQRHVYLQAATIGNVLYQLPCYCRCDRSLGHTSLRSCFENFHGTECSTCAKEAFFAYAQTRAGKTPTQIREAVNRREYESIDLEKQ